MKSPSTFSLVRTILAIIRITAVALFLFDFSSPIQALAMPWMQSCPPPPAGSSQPLLPGTQPDQFNEMRNIFTQAGRNVLGGNGPTYYSINHGNPPTGDTVSTNRPIPHIILRGMAWQESSWTQFSQSTGCTLTSADGGYGIMQITGCMKSGVNCTGISQPRVAGEWKYNIGTGTTLLIEKWNSTPTIDTNDHTVPEQWYYAIMAYNGYSDCNDPNRNTTDNFCPVPDPFYADRPPFLVLQRYFENWVSSPSPPGL
jgi:hypothetical protein